MQSPGREPSMEDILASIKKVIAEEKDLRAAPVPAQPEETELETAQSLADDSGEEDVLELHEPLAPPMDLGPPLIDEQVAETSRHSLEVLSNVAATVPRAPQVNPLEEMIRELLRPILKQWLDNHLPGIVDEHVKREITRITGRPL
jgi:cell pole-organizing protein PopZ